MPDTVLVQDLKSVMKNYDYQDLRRMADTVGGLDDLFVLPWRHIGL